MVVPRWHIESSKVHTLESGVQANRSVSEVMKESAEIAYSYVVGHLRELGCDEDFFDMSMVHLHVPEGATPRGRAERWYHHGDGVGFAGAPRAHPPATCHDRRINPNGSGSGRWRYSGESHRGEATKNF